jgi:hypothetical protein
MTSDRNDEVNPYAAPQSGGGPRDDVPDEPEVIVPCPACGNSQAYPAPYSWWRGRRAPRAIQHVICRACRCEYNGETGIRYRATQGPLLMFLLALALFLAYLSLICSGALLAGAG